MEACCCFLCCCSQPNRIGIELYPVLTRREAISPAGLPELCPIFLHIVFQVWIEHSSVEFEHFALLCGMSKICSTCVSSAGIGAQVQGLGDKRPEPGNCVLVQTLICSFLGALS